MTQTEFDKLPGLLPAKLFRQATGLTKEKLRHMRQTGFILGVRQPGSWKFYYRKCEAAALTGYKMK